MGRKPSEPERFLFFFPETYDRLCGLGLSDRLQREWLCLLVAQLRYGYTYSAFHPSVGYPRKQINAFIAHGLLEHREDGHLHIVEWEEWNGRTEYKRSLNRERQQRFRDRRRDSRNGDS